MPFWNGRTFSLQAQGVPVDIVYPGQHPGRQRLPDPEGHEVRAAGPAVRQHHPGRRVPDRDDAALPLSAVEQEGQAAAGPGALRFATADLEEHDAARLPEDQRAPRSTSIAGTRRCWARTVDGRPRVKLAGTVPDDVELESGADLRFSPQVTVGPISFEVREGEFFSLLGPSGCGKTTTLRCIAGFESLIHGAIALDGQRLDDRPPHRRDVGLVFQNYALFPHLTVFDNVAFGLRLRRSARREIARRVGADPGAGRPAGTGGALSGAALRRPAAARRDRPLAGAGAEPAAVRRAAVESRPQAAHPDARRAERLQRRLGKTAIYVTHDQTEALALSDRIAVLSQGRIEQIGTPSEIYERPATAFVADFIGSSNLLPARIVGAGQRRRHRGRDRARAHALDPACAPTQRARTVSVLLRPERFGMAAGQQRRLDRPTASRRASARSPISARTCISACSNWPGSPCGRR